MAQLHQYRYTLTGDTTFGNLTYTNCEIKITNFEYDAPQMSGIVTFQINNKNYGCFSVQLSEGQENVSAEIIDLLVQKEFKNAVRTFPI